MFACGRCMRVDIGLRPDNGDSSVLKKRFVVVLREVQKIVVVVVVPRCSKERSSREESGAAKYGETGKALSKQPPPRTGREKKYSEELGSTSPATLGIERNEGLTVQPVDRRRAVVSRECCR